LAALAMRQRRDLIDLKKARLYSRLAQLPQMRTKWELDPDCQAVDPV
jgi:hypothetical protein